MTSTQDIINFFVNELIAYPYVKYEELSFNLNKFLEKHDYLYNNFIEEYIYNYLIYDLKEQKPLEDDNMINEMVYLWKKIFSEIKSENNINYSIKQRRTDETFKKEIRKRENNKCQVSGYYDTFKNFECAHIYEFSECNNDYEKYDMTNGLLLRTDIHRAWDAGYLIIEYNLESRKIFFRVDNSIKLSETYLACYETDFNIIPIKFEEQYFEEFCKYIDLRNKNLS